MASSGVLVSQGMSGFDATPAFGMTMSIVFEGENVRAAVKAETRSVHFVTSVLWCWVLGMLDFGGIAIGKALIKWGNGLGAVVRILCPLLLPF